MAAKNGFSSGLPTRPNATIRSPVVASMEHGQPAANTACQSHNALIFRLFCSLRLSVRTPPFHGGESGSIPLGSATTQAEIFSNFRYFTERIDAPDLAVP